MAAAAAEGPHSRCSSQQQALAAFEEEFAATHQLPLRVLVIGATGVGKSSLINALLDELLADASQRLQGGTKMCKKYEGQLKVGHQKRAIELTDTSGVGDPEVSFEEAMGALVMEQGMLGKIFDLVLICDKDDDRIQQQLRRALQVIDVLAQPSGVSPWPNVILVGTQADRWNKRDVQGKRIDPIKRFYEQKLVTVTDIAIADGATTCRLRGQPVTAFEEDATPQTSVLELRKVLMQWPSHLDVQNSNQGVHLRVFDLDLLAERYSNIDRTTQITVAEDFKIALQSSMRKQELAVAWTDLENKAEAFRQLVESCPRILEASAQTLQELLNSCEDDKELTVGLKAVSTELAVLGFILVIFPPTTVLGIAYGIAGGVVGLAAAGQEIYTSSQRGSTIQDRLKCCAESIAVFQNLSRFLRDALRSVMERMGRLDETQSPEMQVQFEVLVGSLQSVLGVAQLGGNITGAAIDASKAGVAGFKVAGESTVTTGAKIGGVALAGVGAILSVVDLAYTASNEPPHKSELVTAIEQLHRARASVLSEARVLGGLVDEAQTFRRLLP